MNRSTYGGDSERKEKGITYELTLGEIRHPSTESTSLLQQRQTQLVASFWQLGDRNTELCIESSSSSRDVIGLLKSPGKQEILVLGFQVPGQLYTGQLRTTFGIRDPKQ